MTSLKPCRNIKARLLCRKTWIKTKVLILEPVTTLSLLNELHFIAINNLAEVQLGADLLFGITNPLFIFKQVILKDQYIPALSGDFQPKQTTCR